MNMTFEDIITLAKAGFSANQISAIYSASAKPAAEPPKPEPPKVEEPKPAAEPPKPEQPKVEEPKEENETQKMLREMLGLMKGNNINNMSQPNTEPTDPAKIMASILNP